VKSLKLRGKKLKLAKLVIQNGKLNFLRLASISSVAWQACATKTSANPLLCAISSIETRIRWTVVWFSSTIRLSSSSRTNTRKICSISDTSSAISASIQGTRIIRHCHTTVLTKSISSKAWFASTRDWRVWILIAHGISIANAAVCANIRVWSGRAQRYRASSSVTFKAKRTASTSTFYDTNYSFKWIRKVFEIAKLTAMIHEY
jgi:hypothetical protein